MPRRLSSGWTWYTRRIAPIIWIAGSAGATFALLMVENEGHRLPLWVRGGGLLAIVAACSSMVWLCVRLRNVAIDGSVLIIEDGGRVAAVPLRELERVTESHWINIRPITLHFRGDTELGRKVVFMPTMVGLGLYWSHPVVEELRAAARLAAHAPDEAVDSGATSRGHRVNVPDLGRRGDPLHADDD